MATKTWNGSSGSFSLDGNWSPLAAPVAGDIAVITAGTVTATGVLPSNLVIGLTSSNSSSPTLILSDATLAASSILALDAGGTNASLRVRGTVTNRGTITATGTAPGTAFFQIDDALGGGATNFINTGSILVTGTAFQAVTFGSNPANQIQNDGLISVRSTHGTPQLAYVAANLAGTGTVLIGCCVTFEAVRAVSAGQTFVFEHGIGGASTLLMDAGQLFAGAISGFASSDRLQLTSPSWNTAAYASTGANSGVLTLALNGVVSKSISFRGAYTLDSFKLQQSTPAGNSQVSTVISTTVPETDSFTTPFQTLTVEALAGTATVTNARPGNAIDLIGITNATLNGTTVSTPNGSIKIVGLDAGAGLSLSSNGAGGTKLSITDRLFDSAYYLAQNAAVVTAAGMDPYQHFMTVGWKQGRNPSALFDVSYYRTQNADVAAAGLNPLVHFEQYGWREGREPSLVFSGRKYLAANPDVKAAKVNPLLQYVQFGRDEGRAAFQLGGLAAPNPLIDTSYYNKQLGATLVPAGAAAAQQAASGYDTYGWQHKLNPNALFDTKYYLQQHRDVAAAKINPLTHYQQNGWREGRDASLLFSGSKYLAANKDVRTAKIDPLQHYIRYGQKEGRMAFLPGGTAPADRLVDAAFYDKQLGATLVPAGAGGQQQAASSYDVTGWKRGLNPNAFFDTNYYLTKNSDVAAARINPLHHYERYGWKEGRNPSAQFSTKKYLAAYSDVNTARVNPLLHYVAHGQAEGRTAFTV